METPISAHPPQKSSFIPFLSDKKVSLIAHAIKSGRMKMPTPIDKESIAEIHYNDVLNNEVPDVFQPEYGRWQLKHVPEQYLEWLPPSLLPNYQTNYHRSREIIRPPKSAPEGNDMSYRPPLEYIMTKQEEKVAMSRFFDKSYNPCKHIDEKPLFPRQYDNLRSVGFSPQLIIDVEKRIKDLVHATRIKKEKVHSSTDKILEQVRPTEETFRPYPNIVSADLESCEDAVLCISVSCCGKYFATIGYQSVKIWSTDTVLLKRSYALTNEDTDRSIRNPSVAWNPNNHLMAVANGNTVQIINPCLEDNDDTDNYVQEWYKQSKTIVEDVEMDGADSDGLPLAKKARDEIQWNLQLADRSQRRLARQGNSLVITMEEPVIEMSWHLGADYLHTITGRGKATSSGGTLHLHRLSKCMSKNPFTGRKHQWLMARFHSVKTVPLLYLADCLTTSIQVYHLHEKKLVKTLQLSCKPSAMQMHPSGNHLIVGTFEGKLCCFDLDMGITPFKTLNLGRNIVRSVTVHSKYPLLACSTANGSVIVLYAKVYTSFDHNPEIHAIELFERLDKAGDMYATVFHPTDPTLVCGGADKVIRLIKSCH